MSIKVTGLPAGTTPVGADLLMSVQDVAGTPDSVKTTYNQARDFFVSNTGLTTGVVHSNGSGALSSSLIVNADVDAAAAIADTKLATISTAGKVSNSATTATTSNTPNTIVLRDGSGNLSVGDIISQSISLEEPSGLDTITLQAPTLGSSYTITFPDTVGNSGEALINDGSGNLTWGVSASGDFVGPASSTDSAVVLFDGTTGKLGKNSGVTISGTNDVNIPSLTASQAVVTDGSKNLASLQYTNANTASTLVQRDGSGNFSAGTITASVTGHASLDLALTGGTVTGTIVGSSTTVPCFRLNSATTAQINLMSPTFGDMVANSTTNQALFYNGSAWVIMG